VQILVIEDEPKLAKAVKEGLEADDYSVALAFSGEDGFYQLCQGKFDLAILDVMLPGRDGFEILRSVRQMGLAIPILLLTARDAVEDRVRGLDTGADDYLVKPFAFPELQARVRALLRRGTAEPVTASRLGDLEIDIARRVVARAGQRIELTSKEYEILEYLFRYKGRVVSREMLVRDVWKEPGRQTPLDNVIDVHVNHLRRKLDDNYSRKLLHTVRGLGFILREEES
jgi:two-component system, OmpR family, copper resistance phosphate regulon response regulator CusR